MPPGCRDGACRSACRRSCPRVLCRPYLRPEDWHGRRAKTIRKIVNAPSARAARSAAAPEPVDASASLPRSAREWSARAGPAFRRRHVAAATVTERFRRYPEESAQPGETGGKPSFDRKHRTPPYIGKRFFACQSIPHPPRAFLGGGLERT